MVDRPRSRRGGARIRVNIPKVSLPRLSRGKRNPPGWSDTDIRIRTRGPSYVSDLEMPEPAGDPPPEWDGTRPEWAIYWAFLQKGMRENEDFYYRPAISSVGVSYFSTVDFLVPDFFVAIEVQGEFWHYGQGSERMFHDMQRAALFLEQGIDLIHIDAEDALSDPEHYLDEALRGFDHSMMTQRL